MFSLQQNWRTRGWNRFCLDWGGIWGVGSGDSTAMYTHVSQCKNNKINIERKKEKEYDVDFFIFYCTKISG
jgi:hypothetical protein